MRQWRLLRTGNRSPAENMAIDEAILIAYGEGGGVPTIRFYGWNPPTLSIGCFQKAEREIDFDRLRERGIGFVRRPTGGRAVLHDRELTYSLVVSEGDVPRSVTESYRELSIWLLEGFRRLGLEADMAARTDGIGRAGRAPAFATAACFDSPSWYELVVDGRKIAGSAQMRSRGAVLQHGSVPLELDADKLFGVLRYPNEQERALAAAAFARKAASVNELLVARGRPPIDVAEAEQVFTEAFAAAMGAVLVPGELTEEERKLADVLVREKYGADEWNLRR